MRKNILSKSLIMITVTVLFFGFFVRAFADASSTTELINAEILSDVWYSTTTINENDSINIYAGFQNHSPKNLSGTVGFFINDLQIATTDFVASPKSLIKLETDYKTVRGEYTIQVKVLDIAEVVCHD